jgi:glycosyltransferase involved in cell wall biosynthesis
MKILVLCYEYPPVGGGGGRVAASVAEGLAALGHEVKVVSAGLAHLPERENRNGIDLLRPRSFRKREDTCSVPEMALYLITSLLPAWKICRNWKPDVIHAHFVVPTGALAFALHLLTGIPYVLTAHLGDVPGGVPEQTDRLFKVLGPAIRPIWRYAAGVTAVSGFVAQLAREAEGIDSKVILNGIDPVDPPPSLAVQTPPRLLLLGRLSVQKDPVLAIESVAAIRDLPWTLDIIGEGPLGDAARARVEELGLRERIVFHGWKSSAEVRDHLRSTDILLMTSTQEGLPVAGIEALHHGVAIVGSRIGGLLDLVDDGTNGYLVPRTATAFSERLRELLSDARKLERFRKAALKKADDFRLADRVRDYEAFLKNSAAR